MDDFNSLSNRLLLRCPNVGIQLAQQLVNDSWRTLQARREWSFRRQHGTFAPPNLYNTGQASSNVFSGNPTLITGVGTVWTPDMIGRQIRIGGLLYPFYTIVGWLSATSLLIDQPWAGPDVYGQAYTIVKAYFEMPDDFGYMYAVVSIKDGFRLFCNLTQADLAMMDSQRTNFSQTYAVVFKDYFSKFGGIVGPAVPINNLASPAPISTTTDGFSYVANATYIIQVVGGGVSGVAGFSWMRSGQSAMQPVIPTADVPLDLSDGVQIYWPDGVNYVDGSLFIINCQSLLSGGRIRQELWPAPSFSGYLYPFIYISKETDLTKANPYLPPLIANRGEVILEMALEKCAEFPGQDSDHINIYHDLKQARYHADKVRDMLIDLERNDEEVGVTNIDFQIYPYAPSPWMDGQWQQTHAPYLNG